MVNEEYTQSGWFFKNPNTQDIDAAAVVLGPGQDEMSYLVEVTRYSSIGMTVKVGDQTGTFPTIGITAGVVYPAGLLFQVKATID